MTRRRPVVEVWEPGVGGWVRRTVPRAHVPPRRGRSRVQARGSDPHESSASWPGMGYSAREVDEGVRAAFGKSNKLRVVLVEISELAEACAKGVLGVVEVANRLGGQFGGFGAAFALLVAIDHSKRKRRRRR